VLSPAQVLCFMDCQSRWFYKYVLNLPDPKNSGLALGIAVHAALAFNFAQKVDSGCDLPMGEVLSHFEQDWDAVSAETEFRDEEDPVQLAAQGRTADGKVHGRARAFDKPRCGRSQRRGKYRRHKSARPAGSGGEIGPSSGCQNHVPKVHVDLA
jgi:hypothetical protein